jgi:hypothetical protein
VLAADASPLGPRFRQRWRGWPRWIRRTTIAAAIILTAAAIGVGVTAWVTARARAARVELAAALGVRATSEGANGGRIDHYLTVRNAGPLDILLLEVRLRSALITGGDVLPAPSTVPHGRATIVPLNLLLDCRGTGSTGLALTGHFTVVPRDGHQRTVTLAIADPYPDEAVAAQLCRKHPSLAGDLSDPMITVQGTAASVAP